MGREPKLSKISQISQTCYQRNRHSITVCSSVNRSSVSATSSVEEQARNQSTYTTVWVVYRLLGSAGRSSTCRLQQGQGQYPNKHAMGISIEWTGRSTFLRLNIAVVCLVGLVKANYRCPADLPTTSALRTYRDKCYQFVYEEKYWPQARDFCWQHGGRLVKINDASTNAFITGVLNRLTWRNNGVWIGLHDRDDELRWEWVAKQGEREEQLTWWNWDSGHPGAFLHSSKDCVRISRDSGWKWHETPCSSLKWHYRFICEYDMLPETTTKTTTNVAAGILPQGQNTRPGSDNSKHVSTTVLRSTSTTESKESTFTTKQDTTPIKTKPPTTLLRSTTSRTSTTTDKTTVSKKWQDNEDENMIEPVAAQQSKEESNQGGIIGGVMVVFVGAVAVLIILFLILRRRRKKAEENDPTVHFDNPSYGGSGRMNNTEPHVAIGTLPGIPRLENLEGHQVTGNVYSGLGEVRGACAMNVDETKGACGATCDVDNDDIDTMKKMKSVNITKDTNEMAAKSNVELPKDPNLYVAPGSPTEESEYSEANDFSGYLPMDGSRRNSLDDILVSRGSTSTCSVNSVGYQYDVPKVQNCALGGYDMPQPQHIYSEIPEQDAQENVYETLDDIQDRLKKLESENEV